VSDVNMEEGSLRCDANISVRPVGSAVLGTKTELKNMNSFRFIERGIRAEVARQEEILRAGGEVEQETLHFDPRTERITSLRSKEEAHDYRYFPEPDLLPIAISQDMIDAARAAMPELPVARQERLEALGLTPDSARQLAWRPELGDFFEAALAADAAPVQPLANWVTGELVARIGERDPRETSVAPDAFASLVGMVAGRALTPANGKVVLERLVDKGGDPAAIVAAEGLAAVSDAGELEGAVVAALAANEDAAEKIRAGNMKAIGAIIGHVMRETRGRADGAEVTRIVRDKLGV
jgi:aspartyl-tRNA(Asn)/glutamyl-tRNA(Gln) amidotransferase subunit B